MSRLTDALQTVDRFKIRSRGSIAGSPGIALPTLFYLFRFKRL